VGRKADIFRRIYEGVHYRLRGFADGRFANLCRPTSILFTLTMRCNARCVHCDIWKNRGKEDVLTLDEWKKVLTELRRWLGPVQVTFTGGEALLYNDAIDVIGYGSSIGLAVEVLSHGYWDDQTRIENLALANPWRVTISLDGVGSAHTTVRGREKFFEKTTATLDTLRRMRRQHRLGYRIRLKTVVMAQNIRVIHTVAEYARHEPYMDVFYQPIEQNYNTPEDPRWFERSENWPRDIEAAAGAVNRLIAMKREGYPIANSLAQLEVMIPYFRDPDAMRVAVQSHAAHERKAICGALTSLQLSPNGDARSCASMPPVGNLRSQGIREIWEGRPHWWEEGCCLVQRCSPSEKQRLELPVLAQDR